MSGRNPYGIIIAVSSITSQLLLEGVYEGLVVLFLEPFGNRPAGLLVVASQDATDGVLRFNPSFKLTLRKGGKVVCGGWRVETSTMLFRANQIMKP